MAWQRISPEVTVMSFKKCCIFIAMDKTADDVLWNGSEDNANVRNECKEMKALTVKMETATVNGKGR
jgi:hypothetical protein